MSVIIDKLKSVCKWSTGSRRNLIISIIIIVALTYVSYLIFYNYVLIRPIGKITSVGRVLYIEHIIKESKQYKNDQAREAARKAEEEKKRVELVKKQEEEDKKLTAEIAKHLFSNKEHRITNSYRYFEGYNPEKGDQYKYKYFNISGLKDIKDRGKLADKLFDNACYTVLAKSIHSKDYSSKLMNKIVNNEPYYLSEEERALFGMSELKFDQLQDIRYSINADREEIINLFMSSVGYFKSISCRSIIVKEEVRKAFKSYINKSFAKEQKLNSLDYVFLNIKLAILMSNNLNEYISLEVNEDTFTFFFSRDYSRPNTRRFNSDGWFSDRYSYRDKNVEIYLYEFLHHKEKKYIIE